MNPNIQIPGMPWMQNVVDNAIHAAVNAAEGIASTLNPDHVDIDQRGEGNVFSHFHMDPSAAAAAAAAAAAVGGTDHNRPAPPASDRAIRQLPTIRVAPEDLVEPCNRECCICLEENHLNDKVTRLPCAHIFHSHCLIDWLSNHHCTCPVCRYELPTDDPQYEAGRLERMKHRKPRYAMYELQRMTIPQLLALNKKPAPGILEKKDLIKLLVENERVHLIPAPEPVNYKLSDLQAMGISKLKRTMEEAGVFFHPKDVVEKSDMLTIFQNSGRLNLIPSDNPPVENPDQHASPDATTDESDTVGGQMHDQEGTPLSNPLLRNPVVETVAEDSDDENETPGHPKAIAKKNLAPPQEMFPTVSDEELLSQTSVDESYPALTSQRPSNDSTGPIRVDNDNNPSLSSERIEEDINNHLPSTTGENQLGEDKNGSPSNDVAKAPHSMEQNDTISTDGGSKISRTTIESAYVEEDNGGNDNHALQVVGTTSSNNTSSETLPSDQSNVCTSDQECSTVGEARVEGNSSSQYSQADPVTCPFRGRSISELQGFARQSNIDLSECVERSEMVQLLKDAGIAGNGQQEQLTPQTFNNWSVSQLRALANEVDVDLSKCSDREQILDKLLHEANNERPFLKNYLRALSPLASSSISELRGVAREWQVNISDCLEKEEIIHRLVTQGRRL